MTTAERTWVPLSARERRILGVLVEKQKTTPEYYPMTVAAITTGCNQKSNRDPVVAYEPDDVEDTLHDLRAKGAALMVEGQGRATKWKHLLYDWLGLKGRDVDMAVVAELLLRGAQTEGELRARASRMNPIADLPALQAILERLVALGLAVYLSPPGQKRGVVVAHGLYPADELERVRASAAGMASDEPNERPRSAPPPPPGWGEEADAMKAEIASLREELAALGEEVRRLKSALGE